MEREYVGEILEDGRLSLSPEIIKHFKIGEKVKVRLRREKTRETEGLSPQAIELIRSFEEAPDRGGYGGHEVTRDFIHEREDIF